MHQNATIIFIEEHTLVMAEVAIICDAQAFRDLAPSGLYVGSVFHGYGDTWQEPDYQALALEHFNIMASLIYLPSSNCMARSHASNRRGCLHGDVQVSQGSQHSSARTRVALSNNCYTYRLVERPRHK